VYVGYVTEGVARERRQRAEMLARLHQELRGMNRIQSLAAGVLADMDAPQLFEGIATTATDLLGSPCAGVVWIGKDSETPQVAAAPGLPGDLRDRLRASFGEPPLASVFKAPGVVRLEGPGLAPLVPPGSPLVELLLAPIVDRAGGTQGILAIGWKTPHAHVEAEEQAAALLVQQAALLLENATLYRMLSQTRDVWQSAFQSIPTPVVIVDGRGRIVQVNPAFLQLGEFDCVTVIGSSFGEALAGATFPNGRPATGPDEPVPSFDAARLDIPRLGGRFDVTRGPFFGTGEAGTGTVWVLRRLEDPA
jgi:PAS domain-containing protein